MVKQEANTGLESILEAARQEQSQTTVAEQLSDTELTFGEAIDSVDSNDFDNTLIFGSIEIGLSELAINSGIVAPQDSLKVSEIDFDSNLEKAIPEITVEQFINMSRSEQIDTPAAQIWGSSDTSVENIKASTARTGQDEAPADIPDMDIGL